MVSAQHVGSPNMFNQNIHYSILTRLEPWATAFFGLFAFSRSLGSWFLGAFAGADERFSTENKLILNLYSRFLTSVLNDI